MADTRLVKDPVARWFLEEKLPEIERIFAPVHIILFGSRAAGKAREGSDADLILVSERFRGIRFPDRMAEFLIRIRPKPEVEVFCYTPEELNVMRRRLGVVSEAVRDGIWLQ